MLRGSYLFAYIDETGNTGDNLFDGEQPVFLTGALVTRCNFDALYSKRMAMAAKSIGEGAVHANKLGLGKIEEIAPLAGDS